jgi:hypothetical protein
MEERSQSQSRMRPRPLFAGRQAVDRSSWPSVSVHLDSPLAKAAGPSHSYLGQYERVSDNDGQDDIAGTYRAHVDRSILSMQRQDKRHSWYLLDSLIQMQGALDQTITETPRPNSRLLSDDRISSAQIRALLHQLETGNNGTSDDEMKATPADLPGDFAQRFADTSTSVAVSHQEPLFRSNDPIATAEASPPLIPTRRPERPSTIALGKRRAITPTEDVEDKDVLNDSSISINM